MFPFAQCRQNVGVHFETWNAGVLGPVTLKGLNEGTRDMSGYRWSYKVHYQTNVPSLSFSVIYFGSFYVLAIVLMFWEARESQLQCSCVGWTERRSLESSFC